jgi:hypothetical protein
VKTRRYRVEVWELVASVVYVEAPTAKEAGQQVRDGVRPSGVYRRTIKRVERAD